MSTEPDDLQDQLRDFMEAAQKPQPPLNNTELRKIRLLITKTERNEWAWTRTKVMLPWAISILASLAAGGKWLIETIGHHS